MSLPEIMFCMSIYEIALQNQFVHMLNNCV